MELHGLSELPPPTVGRAELARWLGISEEYLYSKLPVLTRDHGFPQRLPGSAGKWSRAAVLAWIDGTAGAAPTVAPAPAVPTLDQIYGGVA